MPTKVIVTNGAALAAKYGAGEAQVQTAVQALVAADAARGIQTRVVRLDDVGDMAAAGGTPVATATDYAQNKAAVDAVATRYAPDFILILGAVDVVPYQDLNNPAYTGALGSDIDRYAWSDVPYACTAPYSQEPHDFLAPTRIVGRLPDLARGPGEGTLDPAYLVGVLNTAAGWSSQPASDYQSAYFGMSTDVWQGSTSANVTAVFGSAAGLGLSPPGGSPPGWPASDMGRRSWFINCHGATVQPKFYGQKNDDHPVALQSPDLAGAVTPGTVAAVECCYGAELYAPALRKGVAGIANTFFEHGGWGWFGATTTAYGPSVPPLAQADLMCQYFMVAVLGGATQGEAALRAHLSYVAANPVMNPIDLKTVVQFVLLGDPSIQPVQAPAAAGDAAASAHPDAVASDSALSAATATPAAAAEVAAGVSTATTQTLHLQDPAQAGDPLRALMGHMRRPVRHVATFAVDHPAAGAQRAGARLRAAGLGAPGVEHEAARRPDRIHLLFSEVDDQAEFPDFEVIVAHETDGNVVLHQHLHRH